MFVQPIKKIAPIRDKRTWNNRHKFKKLKHLQDIPSWFSSFLACPRMLSSLGATIQREALAMHSFSSRTKSLSRKSSGIWCLFFTSLPSRNCKDVCHWKSLAKFEARYQKQVLAEVHDALSEKKDKIIFMKLVHNCWSHSWMSFWEHLRNLW